MECRKPIVAGQFYPAQHDSCVDEINQYLNEMTLSGTLPETIVAGIVPHAGWTFSGSLAALVFYAVRQQNEKVHTFVVFGAAHSFFGNKPAVYDRACWLTPMGEIFIDEQLADAVIDSGMAVSSPDAHQGEHSIEVQVPFIQYLFAGAKIVPILVPPGSQAVALGEAVGEIISKDTERVIVCIGSTDLTHYGPRYGFTPMGVGSKAIEWASQVNDKRFIDLALNLQPEAMLTSAAENCNACGPGAAAAAVATAKKLGRTKGNLLAQTNSRDVMLEKMGTSSAESVGYAAIVF